MISWMIRPPCEITDQLAVGTENCFSTLFYRPYSNIKTSAQNALPDKKSKHFLGRGLCPLPRPLPHWGGRYPLPKPHPTRRLRRSPFPFFFIYHSNTDTTLTAARCLCVCVYGCVSVYKTLSRSLVASKPF